MNRPVFLLSVTALILSIQGCSTNPPETRSEIDAFKATLANTWFSDGQSHLAGAIKASEKITNRRGAAKNLILFVGDGMGISTVTAARIFEGQADGSPGEENTLAWGRFPHAGLVKTYNVDAQTPDSAGTMTAMASGVKTDAGVLGVGEAVERGLCHTMAGNELLTSLELAELAGMSSGIVSTARITHATPAANYAKSVDRGWEDNSDMPRGTDCIDIASQLIAFEDLMEARYQGVDIDGIEVVMGGGRRHFLPKDAAFNTGDEMSEIEGDRTDGRNLIDEWRARYPDGEYIMDSASFDAIDPDTTDRVFGLFSESHMRYEANRGEDKLGEPSLAEMTAKAINILDDDPDGFILMVESGRVDHAHHAGNAYNALSDAVALSNAVQTAVDMTGDDTLIIVTADHSHTFTISGYPKRGNPILGKVIGIGDLTYSKAEDGMPYTTVGYRNGRGFQDLGDETNADAGYYNPPQGGRFDLTEIDTSKPGFHQEVLVPTMSESHGGEDVGIYATGPGAHLVTGTIEQSIVFHVMEHAGDLLNRAAANLEQ